MNFKRAWCIFVLALLLVSCADMDGTTVAEPATPVLAGGKVAATDVPVNLQVRPADGMPMVHFSAGGFRMGSTLEQVEEAIALCEEHYSICNRWYYLRESPDHMVSLPGFWLDQMEVTNEQFRACVDAGVCEAPTGCQKGEPTFDDAEKADHPVVCIGWQDAQEYCAWVGGRLPTEAEWEYAARGAGSLIYPWGDAFVGTNLNYCDVNCGQSHADTRFDDGFATTAPAGSFSEGESWGGVLNMGGNVSEWVTDWFGAYSPRPASQPWRPAGWHREADQGLQLVFPSGLLPRGRAPFRRSGDPF